MLLCVRSVNKSFFFLVANKIAHSAILARHCMLLLVVVHFLEERSIFWIDFLTRRVKQSNTHVQGSMYLYIKRLDVPVYQKAVPVYIKRFYLYINQYKTGLCS